MKKYAKICQEILTHPLLDEDIPYSKREAWIWLIQNACYSNHSRSFNGKQIDLKRGQFVTTSYKLARAWKWNQSKVKRFLRDLVDDLMINL